MDEIKNKVVESGLIALDLGDFKPNQNSIMEFDLENYLWQGLVLKEKDFREDMKNLAWNSFENKNVFIHCSADAIVPTWAFMLVASKLEGLVKNYVVGSKSDLEKILIQKKIAELDLNLEQYATKRYIIKGCAEITEPAFSMTELMKKIQPSALSIMYGEPCSTVPIYKKPKIKS